MPPSESSRLTSALLSPRRRGPKDELRPLSPSPTAQGSCLHVSELELDTTTLESHATLGIEWADANNLTLTANRKPIGKYERPV
jgi:hypothetical protein